MKPLKPLPKAASGIQGLDDVTGGGLPRGRPTLLCGGAGCGKTLAAMEFLVHGAEAYGENGVFVSFEESAEELVQNVAALGFSLERLIRAKKLFIDQVHVERSEIEETGSYDLEGLFVRIQNAIRTVDARRIALDTIESLFSGLPNPGILRSELRRLFTWLKSQGLTAVVTAERAGGALTRHGLEEYISDCVILLDNRVTEQVTTRRLRVVKYRGSPHGANEYPFLIGDHGIQVFPITSVRLTYQSGQERVSSGVPELDAMLGGKGYYAASTVLISGTAGSGKTSFATQFASAACGRGERCLYFAFEESAGQIVRNIRSVGTDLQPWIDQGLLQIHAERPTYCGLEAHLAQMFARISEWRPRAVVMDPLTCLSAVATPADVKLMLMRFSDHLKGLGITTVMTNLTTGGGPLEATDFGVTSLVDTWILLRDIESGGERNRGLYILKSRGMEHSNQIREFLLSSRGIQIRSSYLGSQGALTGSARLAEEAREHNEQLARQQRIRLLHQQLDARRRSVEAQIAGLQAQLDLETEQMRGELSSNELRESRVDLDRADMAASRQSSVAPPPAPPRRLAKGSGA